MKFSRFIKSFLPVLSNYRMYILISMCLLLALWSVSESSGVSEVSEVSAGDVMINIYGQPLEPCLQPGDSRGSGDSGGYCSEKGGGVHQICMDVDSQSKNFARDTNQGTNWSLDREGRSHCMCLGAWSLYKQKQRDNLIDETSDELQCEAISQISLSDVYTNKWNTWNGHEKPDQIVEGINTMVSQCYDTKEINTQKEYLQSLYCDLVTDKPEFHTTSLYQQLC